MDGLEEVVAPHFAYLEWSDETAPEEAYEDLARESSGPGRVEKKQVLINPGQAGLGRAKSRLKKLGWARPQPNG